MLTAVTLSLSGVVAAHAEPHASVTGVDLTYYPWVDNGYPSLGRNGLVADPELLDAFAREYANSAHPSNTGEMTTANPNVQDFLVWWLPHRLANIAMDQAEPPAGHDLDLTTSDGLSRAAWLAHLTGYYSSTWLRSNMAVFDRTTVISVTPTDDVYAQFYSQALGQYRDAALSGDDARAVGFAEQTLRSNAPLTADLPGPFGDLLERGPAEVGMFGYDAAWLRNLLPPNPNAPSAAKPFTDNYFSANPDVLLDAHFALPIQQYLQDAERRHAEATVDPGVAGRVTEMVRGRPGQEPLLATQQRFTAAGDAIYRNGVIPGTVTIYRGWDQEQYDRLLAWASYAVMYNKADSLNALTAVATNDATLARQEIRAALLWWIYSTTYVATIFDPRNDAKQLSDCLPRFRTG
ncbi:hypothetical protein [Nocardia jinanensis]|uniref:Uncharacterized protein n=1 Tax=Nocardia jinanensis TaxID=382504 RepID=A0A917RKJ5_9NOCA|nr:hypothetical protein [Nocardia jinanensis]GGL12350.1 hypothetical protein GCM10011588_28440 [Nocardia jinanensis]